MTTPSSFSSLLLILLSSCATEKVAITAIAPPEIVIETVPKGATVVEGDVEAGTTPLVYGVVDGKSKHTLMLKREGFITQRIVIVGADVHAHSGEHVVIPLRPDFWEKESKAIAADDVALLTRAGVDLGRKNRCPESLEFLKRALGFDPRVPGAHKMMGNCYAKLKKNKLALDAYKQYLLYNPDAADYDKVQTMIARAQGDIDIPDAPQKKE